MSWTFPYLGETEELNEVTRAGAPGRFIQLSDGYTHYEIGGPEGGRSVILVHGFSVPSFIWDPTFAFLTKTDHRVLRYDLFGRGYSDRPVERYDIDFFCKQLRELLDTLGFQEVNLMGLSLGGPITASFAVQYPERVHKLVLVDPSGAKPVPIPGSQRIMTWPGISELVFGLFGNETMIKGVASDLYGPDLVREFQDKFRVQLKYKGFKRAILSTIRNQMLGDFSATYRNIGKLGIPTLLFWGRADRTLPFSHSDAIRAAIPMTEFHAFDNCGHIPHYEKPDRVNKTLLDFLS